MAGKIQDRGQMRGMLASLKGAWRRVAGGRSDHSAPDMPEPAELQTTVDETPAAESVDAAPAPVYAVPDATAARVVEETGEHAAVEEEPGDEEPGADETRPTGEAPGRDQEPAAEADLPVVDEPAEELAQGETEREPVSEPLEVASDEAAKVVTAPKVRKAAPKKDAAGAAALATGPSPFIAPASTESGPDSSWTVAQLRALAKERGVRGYSSMSKAQLLGALNGPQA